MGSSWPVRFLRGEKAVFWKKLVLVQAKPIMSSGKSSQSDFYCRRTEYPSQAEELGDREPGGIRPLVVKRQAGKLSRK